MRLTHLPLLRILGILLAASVLGGCASTQESGMYTRSVNYDADLYRVTIDQDERNGDCVRRTVLFTSHSRLYTRPHVDRVRAVDQECDATDVSNFEQFEILRSPEQQYRYENSSSFRNQIDEDLWNDYQNALFDSGLR